MTMMTDEWVPKLNQTVLWNLRIHLFSQKIIFRYYTDSFLYIPLFLLKSEMKKGAKNDKRFKCFFNFF